MRQSKTTLALARRRRLHEWYRGATRLDFTDIIIIAIVMAILLFASWKQFPAYDRPFTPRPILTSASRMPAPGSIHTPAPEAASQH